MGYPAILSAVGPGRTRTRDHEVCRAALGNKRCPPAAINATDATDLSAIAIRLRAIAL